MQSPKQDLTHCFIIPGEDWPSASISAALKLKGTNVRKLGLEMGLGVDTLSNAFYRHVPAYEAVIAQKIGLPVEVIWPSRYCNDTRLRA
ncbi:transcriptional regulator [Salmonella enterica subsp. enterica serovar Abaetetuba]|uniref:Transcriptional regulator n=1 Tax=Salmonella enterica subsp. enterica serovar Poona TaxID=436295 RepID=A0A5V6ND02_SALET|nr:helix-turn-helix domain-containing protein [Salmonella enterica]EBS4764306.1 transcriptional regulator [Salmonella enterica subsp. enterica serovar Poona]EBW8792525.1 transcriptional regulator [Salmonella enterica subsp. enterica serovar Oranienburg]EDL3541859.1 transcriptional regulator [Salmonella enterica subsp. enterica serovar Newport]EDS5131757.1 transcriptional regulator [Salmonella enterica subsp. enterica serovar Minnesota]EAM4785495.1 transcriptional regulator [Salmonella enterica